MSKDVCKNNCKKNRVYDYQHMYFVLYLLPTYFEMNNYWSLKVSKLSVHLQHNLNVLYREGSSLNLFVLHSLSHGCFLYTFYLYRVYIKWRLRTLEHFAALFDKLVALPPGGGGHSLLSAIYLPRKNSNIRFKGTGLIRNRFVQQKLIQKLQ